MGEKETIPKSIEAPDLSVQLGGNLKQSLWEEKSAIANLVGEASNTMKTTHGHMNSSMQPMHAEGGHVQEGCPVLPVMGAKEKEGNGLRKFKRVNHV